MKLNAKAFALAAGVLWGAGIALLTILSLMSGYAQDFLGAVAKLYPWYHVSVVGIVVGFIDGFLDGFIGCYIFAWLYNRWAK